jgi:uncharacterized membrane protein
MVKTRMATIHAWSQRLGRWKMIAAFFTALILVFVAAFYFSVEDQPTTTQQKAQITQQEPENLPDIHREQSDNNRQSQSQPNLLKAWETAQQILKEPLTQRILLIGIGLVLAFILLLFVHDIGSIRLYAQSLAHRRNVMFTFSLLLMAEVFKIDIVSTLGLEFKEDSALDSKDINQFAYGILGFFLLYSFVEYCFTFSSDYLRSRSTSKGGKARIDDAGMLVVGLYRVIFDIILPTLAAAYVLIFFFDQTTLFVETSKNSIACIHPDIESAPTVSLGVIRDSLADIKNQCQDCGPAIQDAEQALAKINTTISGTFSSMWFTCSEPKG